MVNDRPDRPDRPVTSEAPVPSPPSPPFAESVPSARAALSALPGLFAEEGRVRAFAAVALGAGSAAQVAAAAGLSVKDASAALRRLREQGVVTFGDDGELVVAHDRFRELAREARSTAPATGDPGAEDDRAGMIVRTFVKDGRLVRLPARWTRKKVVLRHIAEQTFVPGAEYPERTVDEKLRAWCDEGDVDHVTLRRHLVDLGHLRRSGGTYWRPARSDRAGTA
ncbi:DUF2087 domain-containing protein [Streptomyces sp. NPDC016675]|uniref:DUF2087 domain-containing protein n=1 Tax=Streptomyces sp. NPDC016675 TaxID=3364970 RepID=UPI0036FCB370